MNIGGIIGGTIAAIIGAVVWAAIAYYGKVEIGYLALGVGFLVGLGVSAGSRSGGIGAAFIAVVLTVLSLLAGKYAAVAMEVNAIDSELQAIQISDEDFTFMAANDLVREKMESGETVEFLNGKNFETAEELADYPTDILAAAKAGVSEMTDEDKKRIHDNIIGAFENDITQEGFFESFGPIDILFFVLAVFAAGKMALSDVVD
jgi:hypothetical protein